MSSQGHPSSNGESTDRLTNTKFNYSQCEEALRGKRIPDHIGCPAVRACIVRGIHSHHSFATSPAIVKLCEDAALSIPKFSRARNARLIMSNEIPDEMTPISEPYCIWHPDLASKDTYQQLVGKYPSMRYQVGRACAIAGFLDLYNELDVLPDVAIAEEARESKVGGEGSLTIFKSIMAAPKKYAVMDDYTRTIDFETPKSPAFLNGDTQVSYQLGNNRLVWEVDDSRGSHEDMHVPELHLNIKEEQWGGKSDHLGEGGDHRLTAAEAALLYNPLPLDLLTMKKDLYIRMAAYEGNIDRYARLRRPWILETELLCVIRGIYHHTMFARWWVNELKANTRRMEGSMPYAHLHIRQAINARRIMNNDVSGTMERNELPFCIWWPMLPDSLTLSYLAKTYPEMKESIAIAAIFGSMQNIYDLIIKDIQPTNYLWVAAKQNIRPYYQEDLEKRAAQLDINLALTKTTWDHDWKYLYPNKEPSSSILVSAVEAEIIDEVTEDGAELCVGQLQRHVWASPELLQKVELYAEGYAESPRELEDYVDSEETLPDESA